MPGKKDAKEQKSEAASQDGSERAAAVAQGPSVAAHPRAALFVARAKGWGGLVGFLLSGYLSLPSSTLATAGLRALLGGVVCYVAAWAGAVFLWRQLVMLELAAARARVRARLQPSAHAAQQGSGAEHRRANVRVRAQRPVVAYVGVERSPAQTFTIDISAGGLLVAGLNTLQKGEPFEFELSLATGEPPVTGSATVVRADPQGRCAITFNSLGRGDQRRLDQFIFQHLRGERQGAAA